MINPIRLNPHTNPMAFQGRGSIGGILLEVEDRFRNQKAENKVVIKLATMKAQISSFPGFLLKKKLLVLAANTVKKPANDTYMYNSVSTSPYWKESILKAAKTGLVSPCK